MMNQNSPDNLPILLVDDEPQILLSFKVMLHGAGLKNVLTIEDSRQVMPLLQEQWVALVVLDLFMPHISGLELLGKIKTEFPEIPVIVMTAANEVETAVTCMRTGAADYLVKPVEQSRFISSLRRVLELRTLRGQLSTMGQYLLSDKLEQPEVFASIVTQDPKMRGTFQYLEAIACSNEPLTITGETGTGKELFAGAAHELSRCGGPFTAIDIAGLDDTVFSDTLFGHKKGAFTGANRTREGLIAKAAGGTLFLDEIGDLETSSQVKLLRLLQEQQYYPLGSDIPRTSNARIVVATNRDIHQLHKDGSFRRDLYFRLCTHHIHIPPLRQRLEDIPLLVDLFLSKAADSLAKKRPTIPPELYHLLTNYSYPGNVRELRAMIYDAVAQHKTGILSLKRFRTIISQQRSITRTSQVSVGPTISLAGEPGTMPTLKEAENYLLQEALKQAHGNQTIAASLLGLTRQALNKRLSRKKQQLS